MWTDIQKRCLQEIGIDTLLVLDRLSSLSVKDIQSSDFDALIEMPEKACESNVQPQTPPPITSDVAPVTVRSAHEDEAVSMPRKQVDTAIKPIPFSTSINDWTSLWEIVEASEMLMRDGKTSIKIDAQKQQDTQVEVMVLLPQYYELNRNQAVFLSDMAQNLLTNMLKSIGVERFYMTALFKNKPPKNRDPNDSELACGYAFLTEEIKLLKPKLMIALGTAFKTHTHLLPENHNDEYGTMCSFEDTPAFILPDLDFLLDMPSQKRVAWETLKSIARMIHSNIYP